MKRIALILLGVGAVLFLGKGQIAKAAVAGGVKAVTGLRLEIRRLEVGVFQPRVLVTGMKLHNPRGYPERIMADVPEFFVEYDLPAFFTGKVHLRELRLDFKELVVVKNRDGRTNLDSLRAVQKAKGEPAGRAAGKKPGKALAYRIDTLRLRVGRVIYKDHSRGEPPTVREFAVNIDEQYHNITSPVGLGSIILTRALVKTTVASLANLDLGAIDDQTRRALKMPAGLLGTSVHKAEEVAGDAAEALRGIFGQREGAREPRTQ